VRFKPLKTQSDKEKFWYFLATFELPVLTAKAVPNIIEFIKKSNLGIAQ